MVLGLSDEIIQWRPHVEEAVGSIPIEEDISSAMASEEIEGKEKREGKGEEKKRGKRKGDILL